MSDRRSQKAAAAPTIEIDESLRSQLAYLRDLGWEHVYRPESWSTATVSPASPATSRSGATGRQENSAPQRPSSAAPGAGAPSSPSADAQRSRRGEEPETSPGPGPVSEVSREVASDSQLPAVGDCVDLVALGALAEGCTACKLAERRNRVVFGSGPPRAELMVIGEGPGAQEDQQGLPFVGPAGELLTRILGAIGQERSRVYIANVVKCRPPRNRDPQPGEVSACIGYLRRQIELVQPRVLVALGRVAAQAILETGDPVGRMRGRWHSFQETPLRVTYHPAALLRNESLKRPTWEDMKVVRQRLDELREERGPIGTGGAETRS